MDVSWVSELALARDGKVLKMWIQTSITKSGRRKRKKVSRSWSFEGNTTVQPEEDEESDTETSATMATNDNASETPSLIEIWKVLMQIKTITEKLVLDVESLKGNYKELKENL